MTRGFPVLSMGETFAVYVHDVLILLRPFVWSKKLRRHIATAVSEQGSLGQTLVWSNYVKNNNLAEKLNHSETINMFLRQHTIKLFFQTKKGPAKKPRYLLFREQTNGIFCIGV